MKVLFTILSLSTGSLFAIAAGIFMRVRRHQQSISDSILRDSFDMVESFERETVECRND